MASLPPVQFQMVNDYHMQQKPIGVVIKQDMNGSPNQMFTNPKRVLHPTGQQNKGKKGNHSVQTKHMQMNYQMQKGMHQSVSKTSLNAREHQNSL